MADTPSILKQRFRLDQLLGYGLPSLAPALERLHPEDRQRVQEAFQQAVQSRAGIEIDYRLLLSDGLIKHVHQVAQPVVNVSGDVVEIVGTLRLRIGTTKEYSFATEHVTIQ
jgi:PAS domain-containing protein